MSVALTLLRPSLDLLPCNTPQKAVIALFHGWLDNAIAVSSPYSNLNFKKTPKNLIDRRVIKDLIKYGKYTNWTLKVCLVLGTLRHSPRMKKFSLFYIQTVHIYTQSCLKAFMNSAITWLSLPAMRAKASLGNTVKKGGTDTMLWRHYQSLKWVADISSRKGIDVFGNVTFWHRSSTVW